MWCVIKWSRNFFSHPFVAQQTGGSAVARGSNTVRAQGAHALQLEVSKVPLMGKEFPSKMPEVANGIPSINGRTFLPNLSLRLRGAVNIGATREWRHCLLIFACAINFSQI
uniref:Uncharacterized protein n=1 Tax=Fagus sylvatica TaxID=28930 RepID=A0A2N9J6M0_FAGSY